MLLTSIFLRYEHQSSALISSMCKNAHAVWKSPCEFFCTLVEMEYKHTFRNERRHDSWSACCFNVLVSSVLSLSPWWVKTQVCRLLRCADIFSQGWAKILDYFGQLIIFVDCLRVGPNFITTSNTFEDTSIPMDFHELHLAPVDCLNRVIVIFLEWTWSIPCFHCVSLSPWCASRNETGTPF